MTGSAVLEVRGVSKSYGVLKAVDDASLALATGEVTALIGDNGAGKSTLVKMMSGALRPDSGEILVDGQVERLGGPVVARRLGIETVYQDLALLPNLSVSDNLFLGRELMRSGLWGWLGQLDKKQMSRQSADLLKQLGIVVPSLDARAATLSGGQRQSVAIARAVGFSSKVLIMDEPTAALGVAASEAVLGLVESARDRGVAVLIISHILPHVLQLADRLVVLRHGRVVARLNRGEADHDRLIRLIVGFEESYGLPAL